MTPAQHILHLELDPEETGFLHANAAQHVAGQLMFGVVALALFVELDPIGANLPILPQSVSRLGLLVGRPAPDPQEAPVLLLISRDLLGQRPLVQMENPGEQAGRFGGVRNPHGVDGDGILLQARASGFPLRS